MHAIPIQSSQIGAVHPAPAASALQLILDLRSRDFHNLLPQTTLRLWQSGILDSTVCFCSFSRTSVSRTSCNLPRTPRSIFQNVLGRLSCPHLLLCLFTREGRMRTLETTLPLCFGSSLSFFLLIVHQKEVNLNMDKQNHAFFTVKQTMHSTVFWSQKMESHTITARTLERQLKRKNTKRAHDVVC